MSTCNNHNIKIYKPFIKWVGGKTQIIDDILSNFPKEMNNYHEIFLGGGSVLFALLSYIKAGSIKVHNKIYAYDLNEPLINLYKNVQSNPNDLYNKIMEYVNIFNNIVENDNSDKNKKPLNIDEALSSQESYYYWIRHQYNKLSSTEKNSINGSALFLFLNKTCFRGIFRVSQNGFNVPYGHYKNPSIIDFNHLLDISNLIQNVEFINCDFSYSLNNVQIGDFTYLDPPYAPENSKSFVGYTQDGFSFEQHQLLFTICNSLHHKNIKFMMSNSNVKLVIDAFPSNKFNIIIILCKRSINSKDPSSKTNEVIIKSF